MDAGPQPVAPGSFDRDVAQMRVAGLGWRARYFLSQLQ